MQFLRSKFDSPEIQFIPIRGLWTFPTILRIRKISFQITQIDIQSDFNLYLSTSELFDPHLWKSPPFLSRRECSPTLMPASSASLASRLSLTLIATLLSVSFPHTISLWLWPSVLLNGHHSPNGEISIFGNSRAKDAEKERNHFEGHPSEWARARAYFLLFYPALSFQFGFQQL